VDPLLAPQVRRPTTRNSEKTMGRKGIGRRKKSGTQGSANPVMKSQLVQPDEVRAEHYDYGAANRRVTNRIRGKSLTDSDNDSDDDADNQPQGLKLKAVIVGDERFLFGKGTTSIENGKDCILKAVLNSGETTDERVAALVLAMSDAGLQQLVRQFFLKNQAMIEAGSPRKHLFPNTPNHVAVDDDAAIEVASTPTPQDEELRTRLQEEPPTRNQQRRHSRRASILNSAQMDSLEKDSFDFQKNGLRRKNASGKAAQMAKSRQISRIHNAILVNTLNQSQQIYLVLTNHRMTTRLMMEVSPNNSIICKNTCS
jgi:hypothetical protein